MRDISRQRWWAGRGEREGDSLAWYRVVVVAALIATVAITWPLWDVRESPPLLPVAALPALSLGLLLVMTSLVALLAPWAGAVAVTAIVAFGMLADQTRMQPEFFSLPILLWGTVNAPGARLIARVHLIALWFYAGLHKILSPEFVAEAGPRMVRALPLPMPDQMLAVVALGLAALEIVTALLAVGARTRHLAAWSALVLHVGIVITLAPLTEARNIAVWPWNIALACSGFALIAPWKADLWTAFRASPLAPRAVAAALIVFPVGYYAGIVDAYPAHHLYSAATAGATVYCPAGCREEQDLNATWRAMNVPLPPEPRIFEASFAATCAPGDILRITAPPIPGQAAAEASRVAYCRAGSLPAAHP